MCDGDIFTRNALKFKSSWKIQRRKSHESFLSRWEFNFLSAAAAENEQTNQPQKQIKKRKMYFTANRYAILIMQKA